MEYKTVFPNWNLSDCGAKAVSPTDAFACSCRALIALVPTTGTQCPWPCLSLRLLVLCDPPPHRFFAWDFIPLPAALSEESQRDDSRPRQLVFHGHHWFLGNTHLSAMFGGKAVWSQTSDSALRPQPTLPFGFLRQEASHNLPPPQCGGVTKALQVFSRKPLKCIPDAPLISLEVSKRHKGLKFSTIQLLSASTMVIYSHHERKHRSSPTQGYSGISSWNIWSIQS